MIHAYRTYIKILLTLTVLVLAVAGTINYMLDPFQIYHDSRTNKGHYLNLQERFQNLGLIRTLWTEQKCCTTVLLGTSHAQNFEGQKLGKILGSGPVLNLSMSAAIAEEEADTLTYVAEKRIPETVLWELHLSFLRSAPPTAAEIPLSGGKFFPTYLYDTFPLNDIPYLLSWDNFNLTKKQKKSQDGLYEHKEWFSHWQPGFGKGSVLYTNSQLPLYLKNTDKELSPYRNFYTIDKIILPAVEKYKDTKFIFYFPPYSLHHYASNAQEYYNKTMALRKQLVKELVDHKNAHVYMFDDFLKGTDNLDNYKDTSHYHPDIGYDAMRQIANGKALLTPENVDARLRKMTERVNAYCRKHDKDCVPEPIK